MADYAVVNPATGETIREYPTITDEQLTEAIAKTGENIQIRRFVRYQLGS